MNDLISRQAAIDVCNNAIDLWHGQLGEGIVIAVRKKIAELPSAQPNLQPTCNQLATDCISRQAAIDALSMMQGIVAENGVRKGISMAWQQIEDLPSAQPEYCLDEWCTDCKEYDHERHCCPRFNHVIRTTLQEAQERKKGKWITHEVKSFDGCHTGRYFDECSECGKLTPEWRRITEYHGWDFCPNCGARMEEQE